MATSYHSPKVKQKPQGKSGTENRCCDTLAWGYFGPWETGTVSFMWWRQEAKLSPSLRSPIASPCLPPTVGALGHSLSLSGKPGPALPGKLTERQQAGGHGAALQPGRRSPSKAPSSQNSAAGALLGAHPLGSALGKAGRGVGNVTAQWPDATTAPLHTHLSPARKVVLPGHTLGIFPVLFNRDIWRVQH